MRIGLIAGFTLANGVITATAIGLAIDRGGLPAWFVALFAIGAVALAAVSLCFARELPTQPLTEPIAARRAQPILLLAIAQVLGTSSLHSFYPFRLSLIDRIQGHPLGLLPPAPLLLFNYALTAALLVGAVVAASLYAVGRRDAACTMLLLLGLAMLLPNDSCGNAFNRDWIAAIGASPMMFAPTAIGCFVGVCGLRGRRTDWAAPVMLSICVAVTLAGFAHITRLIW